ncbi:MAG: NAD(P)/FAD-dependent oxidoreductase [Gemmatimonadota bacterium]
MRIFDIGIVGGGPAGLSAALWGARYGRSVVVIDSGDPRNWDARGVNGFLGLPGVRPAELRGRGREELRSYGVTLIDAVVTGLERKTHASAASVPDQAPLFAFETDQGDVVHARRVLLAIGVLDVWPDIPELSRVYGANAHVCPDCDGYEARDKRVVVIGSGRRAVAMALALTTWTSQLTIVTNGQDADMDDEELRQKVAANGIVVRTDAVTRIGHVGEAISCLHLANGEALDVDKLFFTIAQLPADDLGVQLGCERDRGDHIVVSEHFATSVDGVYAAGDITPGPQLAVRAAAAGAVAAMAMHKSLVPDQRTLSG